MQICVRLRLFGNIIVKFFKVFLEQIYCDWKFSRTNSENLLKWPKM